MKNRIIKLFETKPERVLSVYFTAGFPELRDTMPVLEALQSAGVDMVEIGMPYSDPVADGPTIQESSKTALDNGMTVSVLFEQIRDMRRTISIPVVLMGYVNPVIQYGIERFCVDCGRAGVDGVILPDLPYVEYEMEYRAFFSDKDLLPIYLITPQTSEGRIRDIDQRSSGFIYMVSTSSTTGARTGISETQLAYFERIADMGLVNPTMIGFGISDAPSFDHACHYASGAIIGSAFIDALGRTGRGEMEQGIRSFISNIKGKTI